MSNSCRSVGHQRLDETLHHTLENSQSSSKVCVRKIGWKDNPKFGLGMYTLKKRVYASELVGHAEISQWKY